jgi:hypothetical protein
LVSYRARAEEIAVRRKNCPRMASPFVLLNSEHQRATVLRLADSRLGDNAIASITGLDVAEVRKILASREGTP